MPLQTSGAISLNDIHVEAGGTSGTQCTINDADILNLISKTSSTQMGFDEWYGASAGPTLQYTSFGTQHIPFSTGKNATPASIIFGDSAASSIVADVWSSASSGRIEMNDYGWLDGSGSFKPGGFFLQNTNGSLLGSNTGSFNRSPGTGVGQYYMRVYYNNSLIFQTNAHYDANQTIPPHLGSTTGPAAFITSSNRTNASLWKMEYYR